MELKPLENKLRIKNIFNNNFFLRQKSLNFQKIWFDVNSETNYILECPCTFYNYYNKGEM